MSIEQLMSDHTHHWECSDVPGAFFCACGANRYWDRYKQMYIEELEVSPTQLLTFLRG